jgi:hypothetical protein
LAGWGLLCLDEAGERITKRALRMQRALRREPRTQRSVWILFGRFLAINGE